MHPNLKRYAVPVVLVLLAVLAEVTLKPVFHGRAPLTVFTLTIILASGYGGLGPGLLATALSAAAVGLLFSDSFFSLIPIQPSLWFYVCLGTAIAILVSIFRQKHLTQRRTKDLLEQSNSQLAERSKDLAQLNQELALLAAIVEGSGDAIIGKDLQGMVLTWNAAAERIYGYTAAEAKGRLMSRMLPRDRPHEEDAILEQIRQGKRVEHFETVRVRKDRHAVSVSLTISPIRDGTGTIIGSSQIARDIGEQKRLDESFRQTQKLESLGVLAGGIAHDFNNLLTGILGHTSLASEMLSANHPAHGILSHAISASERAADLTRQLLAYAGKGRFEIKPVNLSDFIGDIRQLLQASIPSTAQLVMELSKDLPYVDADTCQLQQLIMNLVINGAEAIGEHNNGTVLVRTRVQQVDETYAIRGAGRGTEIQPGTYVMLQVRDNGCGMDEATLSRIFDPFFTTKFTGRGLGLAAVQGIIRGHKGGLRVSSRPGKFTLFEVLLPVTRNQPVEDDTPGHTAELAGHETILLVDDEYAVRQVAKGMLEHYGYTVLLAENGRDGVELFRKMADRIGLVILDMTMPVMSGDETLRNLKGVAPEVKVILSSGYQEIEAVRRFNEGGLAGFLQKPYSATLLAQAVKKALEPVHQ